MDMGSFPSDDHLPSALLATFDIDLQRFYLEALNKELDIRRKQNTQNIKKALTEVVEAYKKRTGDGPDLAKCIRFDSSEKRCAYVLKHSPCFTSAVARHVLDLAGECPTAFRDVILRGEASICCLGGGPASDAVGVCKVLSEQCRQGAGKCLKLKVTVVDVNEDWAVTAGNVLETLKEMPELLGMGGVELSFAFFSADLTRPIDDVVRKVMESADIVTMVYFLSAVNRGKYTIESFCMVKCPNRKCEIQTDPKEDSLAKGDGQNIDAIKVPNVQTDEAKNLFEQDVKKFLSLCIGTICNYLALKDWNIYKNIKKQDIEQSHTSPIVQQMKQNHHDIYLWTIDTILSGKSAKNRAKAIAQFLRIANSLLAYNNLNVAHAIVSALENFSVFRLDKSWDKLSRNKKKLFKTLKKLFADDNYFQLSLLMQAVNNIFIPYLDSAKQVSSLSYWVISESKKCQLESMANERSRLLEPSKRFYEKNECVGY